MTDLAKLVVRLEAQSAQLLTELEKANRKVDKFASATAKTLQKWSAGLLGFFSGRALVNFSQQVIAAEGELVGMAERAGTTVEELSGLGFVADQSASSLAELQKGLGNLADRAADAADKGGASAAAFEKLGIKVKNSDGSLKNSADLLLEIAEQFSQYQDGAAKSALATDLFGKSGKELIPLLNRGADGIEELRKRAAALGITVTQEAAEGANKFSDQLNTLGGIARGVVGRALQDVLPILSDFTDSLINGEDAAMRAERASRVLATGFQLLLSAGTIVGEIFDRVGSAIGAAAAAVVAVAQGEFKRAYDIIVESNKDTVSSVSETGTEIARIWNSTADSTVQAAQAADEKLKKTLVFGGGAGDVLKEVTVSAKKIDKSPIEQFYDDINEMTKTSSELAIEEYNKQKVALETLYDAGRISLEQYNERLTESLDEFLPEFQVTVKRLKDTGEKATDDLNEFQKEAARNTQDIIAGTIRNGFDQSAGDVLKSFGDMLQDLAAQAIAANIGGLLFGKAGGGTGQGFIGAAASFVTGLFGGTRDSGGRGVPGMSYLIGTGAQPERFVPDVPGTFTPAGDAYGEMKIANTFIIQTPTGRVPLETQQQVAARAAQSLERARRRNS